MELLSKNVLRVNECSKVSDNGDVLKFGKEDRHLLTWAHFLLSDFLSEVY